MMLKPTKGILLILLLTLTLTTLSVTPIFSADDAPQPTHTSTHKISENTEKDSPIEIFEVTGNGMFYVYYNWPGTIGATCSAALINIWSFAELSSEEQSEFGNLGHLRILRCQKQEGNLSIAINASETNNYTLPLRFYFEVDNDQSLTGAIQDTLYLDFEYYQLDGPNESTNKVGIGMPFIITIGFMVLSTILLRSRKK